MSLKSLNLGKNSILDQLTWEILFELLIFSGFSRLEKLHINENNITDNILLSLT